MVAAQHFMPGGGGGGLGGCGGTTEGLRCATRGTPMLYQLTGNKAATLIKHF